MALSKEDLIKYKQDIEAQYGSCNVLHAYKDTELKNCDGTSNREAPKGLSWIDYWRAMTGQHNTQLSCSCCGKIIFVGQVPRLYELLYKQTGDEPTKHLACGAHVWLPNPPSGKYVGGRYIAPLCPECNNQRGEIIPILKGTTICKELGAHINDNE